MVKLQEYPDTGGPLETYEQRGTDVVVNPKHIVYMRPMRLRCQPASSPFSGNYVPDKWVDCVMLKMATGERILAKCSGVEELMMKMAIEYGE